MRVASPALAVVFVLAVVAGIVFVVTAVGAFEEDPLSPDEDNLGWACVGGVLVSAAVATLAVLLRPQGSGDGS